MVAKPLCPLYKNIIKPLDRARYPELRYEIIGTQFVPIQHRPIYIQVSKISNKKDFSALVEEPLKLKHNHKYYIGVAVMASSGNGGFSLQIIFCGKNTAISLAFCGVFTAIFVYLQP